MSSQKPAVCAGKCELTRGSGVAAALAGVGRGDVEGRIPGEEAPGLEGEAEAGYRHDGPVLGAGDVVVDHRVPDDQVGVGDRAVGLGPDGEAVGPRVLVGELARGVAL